MRKYSFALIACLSFTFLTGCEYVRGTVTYFYSDGPPEVGQIVTVIPHSGQDNTLEWDTYKATIEQRLTEAGFQVNQGRPSSGFVCQIDYSIDQQGDTRTRAVARYDNNGRVAGVTNYTTQVHQRVLILRFYSASISNPDSTEKPYAEVRVLSEGTSAELARVMPALSKIAFSKWPGVTGKTYSVQKPL